MNNNSKLFFEFEAFRIDVEERRLLNKGELVALTPRVFDTLLTLVESSGQTVEKDTLLQKVWADAFVEEGNLHHYVSALRKILGDDSRRQRLIKTIPKRGYRFTGQVRRVTEEEGHVSLETTSRGRLVIKEETQEGFWTGFRVAALAIGIVVVCSLAAWGIYNSRSSQAAVSAIPRGTTNAAALEAYEKGRALWQTRDAGDLHEAALLLERSVALDPAFARAHAALADVYAFDYTDWKKAETEANRAIALDPSLGEPHATVGFIRTFWEWKLVSAEDEFKRAEELSPAYATAHQWYGLNLAATGHGDAALAEMRRAVELEPDSIAINTDFCRVLYFQHMYDDALAQCRKSILMKPLFLGAHEHIFDVYVEKEMYKEAVDEYFEMEKITKGRKARADSDADEKLRAALERDGIRGFLKTLATEISAPAPSYYERARIHARLGEDDEALLRLSNAYDNQDFAFVFVRADPAFDRFHYKDTVFRDLIDRLLK